MPLLARVLTLPQTRFRPLGPLWWLCPATPGRRERCPRSSGGQRARVRHQGPRERTQGSAAWARCQVRWRPRPRRGPGDPRPRRRARRRRAV